VKRFAIGTGLEIARQLASERNSVRAISLDSKLKIARADLAKAMIRGAKHAPSRSSWDVIADEGGSAPAWLTG
jgi:hypothetical protein